METGQTSSEKKILSQSFGEGGASIADPSTGEVKGPFAALQFLENTTFATLDFTGRHGQSLSGLTNTWPAGSVFYGKVNSFTVAVGLLVAYKPSK